jgi:hypothetical protein
MPSIIFWRSTGLLRYWGSMAGSSFPASRAGKIAEEVSDHLRRVLGSEEERLNRLIFCSGGR